MHCFDASVPIFFDKDQGGIRGSLLFPGLPRDPRNDTHTPSLRGPEGRGSPEGFDSGAIAASWIASLHSQ